MTALGEVRREDHDGGHSVWVRVKTAMHGEHWLCVWSTARGNVGCRWTALDATIGIAEPIRDYTTVIGAVPGTPAADREGAS